MWTILQALGINRWLVYGILAVTLLSTLTIAALKFRADGIRSERAKQLQASLRNLQKEAKERARIEAMRSADARQQLRDKWASR